MKSFRRIGRLVAALALLAYAPACASWHPVDLAPEPSTRPVWVTTASLRRVMLLSPTIVGDSIVGFRTASGFAAPAQSERLAFAIADVTRLEQRRENGGATVLAVVTVVAVVGLAVYAVSTTCLDFGMGGRPCN